MSGHDRNVNAAFTKSNSQSLLEINSDESFRRIMGALATRIRSRMDELGLKPADLARQLDISPQRLNNYIKAVDPHAPDINMLSMLARGLRTTTDWLLGLTDAGIPDLGALILRILELEGMPAERASVVAQALQEALRILSALPDEGEARTRARLAAQAAWHSRPESKPN